MAAHGDEAQPPLASGDLVRAFYHMNDHPGGFRYVRVPNSPPEGTPEAVATIGLSTGWIPATVAEDWKPGQKEAGQDDRVLVKLHGHFVDVYNLDPEPVKGMYWRVKRSLVRQTSAASSVARAPQAKLELSLLVVRWWDYYNKNNRRSRTHNVANEEMLLDVLEGPHSPHAEFGESGAYEVHSAFVRSGEDLEAISSSLAQNMRAQQKAAFYFLWPTQRVAVEKKQAGCVSETSLFALMKRMEDLGVQSRWPHPRPLYRELSGKLWIARTSQGRPELRVPPTVMVDLERWQADQDSAVKDIITELKSIGDQGEQEKAVDSYRGVVKLGFSWMGEDVLPFTGPKELWKALTQLLDGAQPGAVCLVQKRIEDVACEIRTICCRDLAAGPEAMKMELARMKLRQPRHTDETFALTSHLTMTEAEACDQVFKGDAKALQAAQSEVLRLSHLWLAWLRDEGFGVPDNCRLDFIVVAPKASGGGLPDVWTIELCECGGALCGFTHHARTAAAVNACFSDSKDASSRAPRPLPALVLEERSEARPGTTGGWGTVAARGTARPRGSAAAEGSASGSRALVQWFSGLSGSSKIGVILAILGILWRLRSRLGRR